MCEKCSVCKKYSVCEKYSMCKKCSVCAAILPSAAFSVRQWAKVGRKRRCKACVGDGPAP